MQHEKNVFKKLLWWSRYKTDTKTVGLYFGYEVIAFLWWYLWQLGLGKPSKNIIYNFT